MSGYLQRLASRAMNPVEPVHPVLGSMFTAPKYRNGREDLPREEDDLPSIQSESRQAFESARPVSWSVLPDSKHPGSRESSATQEPRTSFGNRQPEPLVRNERLPAQQVEQTLRPILAERASPRPSIQDPYETAGKAEPGRETNLHRGGREPEEASHEAFTPLIKENLARSNEETSRHEAEVFASAAKENGGQAVRSVPATREPDEIQIHIGRIDVTAVPQAASRAVSKPIRKGMNLEEYLSRRDRRT
jgi:hypothetical protein